MSQSRKSLMPLLTRFLGLLMLIAGGIGLWIAYSYPSEKWVDMAIMSFLLSLIVLIIICYVIDFFWRFYHRPDYLNSPAKFLRREWMKTIIRHKKNKRKKHHAKLVKEEERRQHNRASLMANKKHYRIYHKFMSLDERKKGECYFDLIFVITVMIAVMMVLGISIPVFYEAISSSSNETSELIQTKGWVISKETLQKATFILGYSLGIIFVIRFLIWPRIKRIKKRFESGDGS